ncbi:hypothetical protein DICA4_E06964 [Diutina catenulata]
MLPTIAFRSRVFDSVVLILFWCLFQVKQAQRPSVVTKSFVSWVLVPSIIRVMAPFISPWFEGKGWLMLLYFRVRSSTVKWDYLFAQGYGTVESEITLAQRRKLDMFYRIRGVMELLMLLSMYVVVMNRSEWTWYVSSFFLWVIVETVPVALEACRYAGLWQGYQNRHRITNVQLREKFTRTLVVLAVCPPLSVAAAVLVIGATKLPYEWRMVLAVKVKFFISPCIPLWVMYTQWDEASSATKELTVEVRESKRRDLKRPLRRAKLTERMARVYKNKID